MNFEIICSNCGAPSSPSVGVCPFCKAVLTVKGSKDAPTITKIRALFNDGKLDQALSLAQALEKEKPSVLKNPNFVILYVQILLEADGPSSKMKSLLSLALLKNPDNSLLSEYLEIVEAKSHLSHEKNDLGEVMLTNIIRRSPQNVYALFLLGSHLFWVEKDTQRSLKYLEECVRIRPNFLRASACLAALYKTLDFDAPAARLFKRCAALTTSQNMKKYFKSLASTSV